MTLFARLIRFSLILIAIFLVACSGTIQRDPSSGARPSLAGPYAGVEVVLTESARKLQADNFQFNPRELSDYVRRRLEAADILQANAPYRISIEIDHFRVRSMAAAVFWGVMAGADSVDGQVTVLDKQSRSLHRFKVSASYGLGGWGGGQDSTRMGWLYEKFSELTFNELTGGAPNGAANPVAGRSRLLDGNESRAPAHSALLPIAGTHQDAGHAKAAVAPTSATANAPANAVSPKVHLRVVPPMTPFAAIEDVDAIPIKESGKQLYRRYLAATAPKAFVLYEDGASMYQWGKEEAMTLALDQCAREGRKCWLYAVDDRVVWDRNIQNRISNSGQLGKK